MNSPGAFKMREPKKKTCQVKRTRQSPPRRCAILNNVVTCTAVVVNLFLRLGISIKCSINRINDLTRKRRGRCPRESTVWEIKTNAENPISSLIPLFLQVEQTFHPLLISFGCLNSRITIRCLGTLSPCQALCMNKAKTTKRNSDLPDVLVNGSYFSFRHDTNVSAFDTKTPASFRFYAAKHCHVRVR